MRIFLIRHGESKANKEEIISGHSDVSLTKLGKTQATSLARDLLKSQIQFDSVYSSDLVRASETTEIIAKVLGIKQIIFDNRLREQDAGIFTGRKVSSLTEKERKFLETTFANLDLRITGGETNREMTLRIKEAFYEIITKNTEDSTILLVAHGGTLYHILVRILELLTSMMEEWFGNCTKNILERKSQHDLWNIIMLNDKKI